MGAKIQADEISSIIKERIDNFDLNVDVNESDMEYLLKKTPFGKEYVEHQKDSMNKFGGLDFEETLSLKDKLKSNEKYIQINREEYIKNNNAIAYERDFLLSCIVKLYRENNEPK